MAAEFLDCVSLTVPSAALEIFESAMGAVCRAISFYHDEDNDLWDIQGVKERGADEEQLAAGLAMAELLTGFTPVILRSLVPIGGWLARTKLAFPEQKIGARFVIRGSHIHAPEIAGSIVMTLDAGLAFGTGEHNSTRGCLVALERVAKSRRPSRILDLGTGSGILAIACAKLTHQRVLATDLDPRAVRVATSNAAANRVGRFVTSIQADGWNSPAIRRAAPFDLVLANILARPLCAMAHRLAANLSPGGTAILAGLLTSQATWVLSAHRRAGLTLEGRVTDGAWTTLILRHRG